MDLTKIRDEEKRLQQELFELDLKRKEELKKANDRINKIYSNKASKIKIELEVLRNSVYTAVMTKHEQQTVSNQAENTIDELMTDDNKQDEWS